MYTVPENMCCLQSDYLIFRTMQTRQISFSLPLKSSDCFALMSWERTWEVHACAKSKDTHLVTLPCIAEGHSSCSRWDVGSLLHRFLFNHWSLKTAVCICLLNCKLSCENVYGVVLLWSHSELELSTNMINIFLCGSTHCWRAIEITRNWNCLFTRSDSFITLLRSCEM